MVSRLRLAKRSYGSLGVFLFVATLEALTRAGSIPSRHFPPPSETLRTLGGHLGTASLWSDLGSTLAGWAIGLTLAFAIAVPLGIAAGSSPILDRLVRLPTELLRPIPAVALLPLIVLVYGTGFQSKLFFVVFAAMWPLLIHTIYGVRDGDPVAMDTARSFRVGRTNRLLRVTLPGAVPYIATGLRISSSVALTLAVTAELVLGTDGVGRSINLASEGGAVELMYALIVLTGVMGWSSNAVLGRVERRVLHWHASVRRVELAQ